MITKYWCNSNIIVIEEEEIHCNSNSNMEYTVCNSNCNRNYNVICIDYMHAALDS